jgi:hypothetical protein
LKGYCHAGVFQGKHDNVYMSNAMLPDKDRLMKAILAGHINYIFFIKKHQGLSRNLQILGGCRSRPLRGVIPYVEKAHHLNSENQDMF